MITTIYGDEHSVPQVSSDESTSVISPFVRCAITLPKLSGLSNCYHRYNTTLKFNPKYCCSKTALLVCKGCRISSL